VKNLLVTLLLISPISCSVFDSSGDSREFFGTTIYKTTSVSLSKNNALSMLSTQPLSVIQTHASLDVASCGRIIGAQGGTITKTGTFLISFNPTDKKYYMLLARKTKQGEIHQHSPTLRPEYFGSIIVPGDRWGKWVTLGGGYDPSCVGQSSLCAARKEIQDEGNVEKYILKKIIFLDCAILDEKPETALFVAYLDWNDAQKLTTGKDEKQFIGLQTHKTKDLGAGTDYCKTYKCEDMHLFPLDNITLSRKDLIDSSHHEIGYIKWVPLEQALKHELLMNYVENSLKKFFFPGFMKKLHKNIFYNSLLQ
jgi:hypothetical protein